MLDDRLRRVLVRWLTLLTVALLLLTGVAFGSGAAADETATGTPGASASAPPVTATSTTATPATTGAGTVVATDAPATGAAPSTTAPAASPATGTAATPATSAASGAGDDVPVDDAREGGGPKNIVKVQNKTDNRLRVRGRIQVGHIPGDTAEPENGAFAYAACTDCATFAIALQIALISRTASTITPQNAAVAVNVECSNCYTVARAVQFVVQVDDPTQTPDTVKDLIAQMQRELKDAQDKDATVEQTEARVNAVIAQFKDLGQSLYNQRDEKTDNGQPGATVPPDAVVLTPTPTGTPTPPPVTGSATPAASATATL